MNRPSPKKQRREKQQKHTAAHQSDQIEGCKVFAARWSQAVALFDAADKPLWKRTQEGMLAFKGLRLDILPQRLLDEIDRRFLAINEITSDYTLETWEDYQNISDDHLLEIQGIIRGFLSDH